MKANVKNNLGGIFAVLFIVVFVAVVWIVILSFAPPDKKEAEKVLQRDLEALMTVTQHLENSAIDRVYIDKTFPVDKIEDDAISAAYKRLFKDRYQHIVKEGNTVIFVVWIHFGTDYGIAYSINAKEKPDLPYSAEVVPLSESGWFFYVRRY